MAESNKKLYISLIGGLIAIIMLLWLLFRACNTQEPGQEWYYIGRDSTWYPLDFRGKEKNMSGFVGDLVQAIGEEEKFKVIIYDTTTNSLMSGLQAGNYDAVFSSLSPTAQTKGLYLFSDVLYHTGPVLLLPQKSEVKTLADLKGKVIGVESNILQAFIVPESLDVVLIPYDTAGAAIENLDKNIIDGVLLDALRAYVYTHGYYEGKLKIAGPILAEKGERLLTKNEPANVKFIEHFNDGLKKVRQKGLYNDLIEKWNLINTEPVEEPASMEK